MKNPFSAIYGAVTGGRNRFYDHGVLSARRLRGPVVSIGNLTAGGAGKTPFVIALGELLKKRGVSFDVLSRGYKRKSKGVTLVDPDGSPRDFGDEPLLIARRLEVSVIVGENRYEAGWIAEENFGPRLHLLDDGFQHRRLARDLDIVLVTPNDAKDRLLPGGRLREALPAIQRADVVVLTNDMTTEALPLTHQKVWRVRRGIVAPQMTGPCVAFCGIAQPENFFAQLRASGITLAGTRAFRDHHWYGASDVRELLALRKKSGATWFATTEKDAINLGGLIAKLEPTHVVAVTMQIENADAIVNSLLATIAARNHRPA